MKKVFLMLVACILFFVAAAPAGAAVSTEVLTDTVTVTVGSKVVRVNGKVSSLPEAPIIKSGRVFVPLRLAEKLKASVSWDGFTGRIDVRTDDYTDIEFKVGDRRMYVADPLLEFGTSWYLVNMDVAPFNKNGYTFVPLKYLANPLGVIVNYDSRSEAVTIRKLSTAGWKTFTEPNSGAGIKYPVSWTVVAEKPNLELYNNGTRFIYSYEDKTQEDIINSAKALYMREGWKVAQADGTYLKLTKWSGSDQLMKIISTKKIHKGSLVFTVDTLSSASQLDLLICDKMIPGAGI